MRSYPACDAISNSTAPFILAECFLGTIPSKLRDMPTIAHFEIPTDDIERSKKFYIDLFGVKIFPSYLSPVIISHYLSNSRFQS